MGPLSPRAGATHANLFCKTNTPRLRLRRGIGASTEALFAVNTRSYQIGSVPPDRVGSGSARRRGPFGSGSPAPGRGAPRAWGHFINLWLIPSLHGFAITTGLSCLGHAAPAKARLIARPKRAGFRLESHREPAGARWGAPTPSNGLGFTCCFTPFVWCALGCALVPDAPKPFAGLFPGG